MALILRKKDFLSCIAIERPTLVNKRLTGFLILSRLKTRYEYEYLAIGRSLLFETAFRSLPALLFFSKC